MLKTLSSYIGTSVSFILLLSEMIIRKMTQNDKLFPIVSEFKLMVFKFFKQSFFVFILCCTAGNYVKLTK